MSIAGGGDAFLPAAALSNAVGSILAMELLTSGDLDSAVVPTNDDMDAAAVTVLVDVVAMAAPMPPFILTLRLPRGKLLRPPAISKGKLPTTMRLAATLPLVEASLSTLYALSPDHPGICVR